MNCYFGPVNVVYFAIIAHAAHKWDLVPFANYSVAHVIGVFVSYTVEVVSLGAHVNLLVLGETYSSHQQ